MFKAVGLGLVVKEVLLGPTSPVLSSASSVFRTRLAGDSRGPCGRPGARGHRVGYLWSRSIMLWKLIRSYVHEWSEGWRSGLSDACRVTFKVTYDIDS